MTQTVNAANVMTKTANGARWVISWRFVTRALGLVSTLTLVRLLAPTDFGLVALGTAFAQSVDAFSVLGVEDVVVRAKAPGRDIYDTAFTVNAIRGIVTAIVIAAAAVPSAGMFGDPRLTNILLALALAALIDGFENIGIVDFRRDFAFEKEFGLQILPRMAGIVTTIIAALVLRDYWSLVIGIMTTRIIRTALGYVMHPYRPRITLCAWRAMIGFSAWTWFISIAALLRDRAPSLVVARLANATQLGIFSVAAEIAGLPTSELIEPLCRACFSGFAAARHHTMGIVDSYLRVIAVTAAVTLPACVGISLLADPLVRVAFGPRWLEAIVPMEILAVSGSVTVLAYVSGTLLSAHAMLPQLFALTTASVVLRLTLLPLLTLRYGIAGSALGLAMGVLVEQSLYLAAMSRCFGLRMGALGQVCWRPVVATLAMAAVLGGSGLGWVPVDGTTIELVTHLAFVAGAGASIYAAVLVTAWVMAGRPAGAETDIGRVIAQACRRVTRRLESAAVVRPS